MGPRSAIVFGLLSGVLVFVLLVGAGYVLLPDLRGQPASSPSAAPVTGVSPSPRAASPAGRPSASPGATPAVTATGSPGASGSASATPDAVTTNFHVGRPAPPLSVPKLGGGTIDLEELKGKPVWLNFMATWCPSCVDELPLMNSFHVRYAEEGLVVIAVDVLEEEAVAAEFMDSLNIRFPVGLDRDGSAREAWQAIALPVHYWIDAEGIVRDGALGGVGADLMIEALERIMPDAEVDS